MGPRTPQSRSFNTVKHSNRDARIKKRQTQRLLILAMASVIALLVLMLIVFAICSIAQAVKNKEEPLVLPPATGNTLEEGAGMTVVSSQFKTRGPLLIVSNSNVNSYIPDEAAMTTLAKNAQPTFNGAYVYKLSGDIKLHPDALAAFNAMMTEYCKILWSGEDEHGESPVTLVEAFRTLATQEGIYNPDYSDSAKAGHSDHHTGYLLNLSASSSAMTWIRENAHKYGFVFRYPSEKSGATGIVNYPTCIRYVGVAHATYMKANNLCLEEYVATVQQHPWEAPLNITTANGQSYIVYYATAYTAGTGTNITQIKTPANYTVEISGDNIGGFIATVKIN